MRTSELAPRGLQVPAPLLASSASLPGQVQALGETARQTSSAATQTVVSGAAEAGQKIRDGFQLATRTVTALLERGVAQGYVPRQLLQVFGARLGATQAPASLVGAEAGQVRTTVLASGSQPEAAPVAARTLSLVPASPARIDFPNDGTWAAHVQGELVAGGEVVVRFDPYRLSGAEWVQGGMPQWGVAGYYRLNDRAAVHFDASEARDDRLIAKPKTIALSEPGQLSLWFCATNRSGTPHWDSKHGANYVFAVQPSA